MQRSDNSGLAVTAAEAAFTQIASYSIYQKCMVKLTQMSLSYMCGGYIESLATSPSNVMLLL